MADFDEVTAGVFTEDELESLIDYHTYVVHKAKATHILEKWSDEVLHNADPRAIIDALREVADEIADVLGGVDDEA